MNEETFEEKVNKLSALEQNVQYLSNQKQNFNTQLIEVESALNELESSEDAYKIIGTIMVKIDKIKLKKELEEKKEILDIRIKSIEKQEKHLKEKSNKIRDEVLKSMENKKDGD